MHSFSECTGLGLQMLKTFYNTLERIFVLKKLILGGTTLNDFLLLGIFFVLYDSYIPLM